MTTVTRTAVGGASRFGPFLFDPRSGELRKQGTIVHLRPQAADVLAFLLERPGQLVTREELRARVWGDLEHGCFDQGLHDAVTDLRAALSDAASSPTYVETLPRRGYRFIADVDQRQVPCRPFQASRDGHARRYVLLAIALTLLLAGSVAPSATGPERRIRLAVLPFYNVGAADDALSEGLTEELNAQLGSLEPAAFGLIGPATARRYRDRPAGELARDLYVSYVVTGSVRRDADRARISVRLVDARTEMAVWSQNFDVALGDMLGIQSEIAFAVSRRALVSVAARNAPTRNLDPEAESLLLRARQLWRTRRTPFVRDALDLLRAAAAREPGYAPIHSARADALNVLADVGDGVRATLVAQARDEAEQALALDDSLADAHAALGAAAMLGAGGWRWAEAEASLRRALALNPSHASARQWLSATLRFEGRNEEAVAEARRAAALDPLSPAVVLNLGNALGFSGDTAGARREFLRVLDLDPRFGAAFRALARLEIEAGRPAAALEAATRAAASAPGDLQYVEDLACSLVAAGRPDDARRELRRLEAAGERWPYGIGVVHAALGEQDAAVAWIRRAFALGDPSLRVMAIDARVAPLRRRPEFAGLLESLGQPVPAGS
jgi:DNA-binding winged helix-turn-helix (wHTH) protein/TolB-like protein/Tfp pilus assembly protein PilF